MATRTTIELKVFSSHPLNCIAFDSKNVFTPLMHKTHGMTDTGTFISWRGMRARCLNKNDPFFHRYGGRGISICKRWKKFENFLADMGKRPKGKALDRVDNNRDYRPTNCRWATPFEQAANRSNNRTYTVGNKTGCIYQLARHFGISPLTAIWRLNSGKTPQEAFLKKVRHFLSKPDQMKIIALSKSKTVKEIAALFNAKTGTIHNVIWRHNKNR